jgi:hypothetical protein
MCTPGGGVTPGSEIHRVDVTVAPPLDFEPGPSRTVERDGSYLSNALFRESECEAVAVESEIFTIAHDRADAVIAEFLAVSGMEGDERAALNFDSVPILDAGGNFAVEALLLALVQPDNQEGDGVEVNDEPVKERPRTEH